MFLLAPITLSGYIK